MPHTNVHLITNLSARELEILITVAKGHLYKEIAEMLDITIDTTIDDRFFDTNFDTMFTSSKPIKINKVPNNTPKLVSPVFKFQNTLC